MALTTQAVNELGSSLVIECSSKDLFDRQTTCPEGVGFDRQSTFDRQTTCPEGVGFDRQSTCPDTTATSDEHAQDLDASEEDNDDDWYNRMVDQNDYRELCQEDRNKFSSNAMFSEANKSITKANKLIAAENDDQWYDDLLGHGAASTMFDAEVQASYADSATTQRQKDRTPCTVEHVEHVETAFAVDSDDEWADAMLGQF